MAESRRLRPADDLIAPAVAETLENLGLQPGDVALARLAEQYAAAIDAADPDGRPDVLSKLGGRLLSALDALGATPRARAALKKGVAPSGPTKLDHFHQSRGA